MYYVPPSGHIHSAHQKLIFYFPYREIAAVQEWWQSEKSFHIMRDHPQHQTAILGGMWGIKLRHLERFMMVSSFTLSSHDPVMYALQNARNSDDQTFLLRCVHYLKILTFVITSRFLRKPLVIHFCPLNILLNSWWFFLYCKLPRICQNSKEFIRGKKV